MSIEIEYESEFIKFIRCLEESDSIDYVVIIGSWAEYIYYKAGVLPGFEPDMSTIDLDLLIKNLRLPRTARNLVAIAEENGFIYDEDTLYGTSKFFGKDQFEVEFLISQLGNGSEKLPRTKLGVNAQQLTHVSMLKDNSMTIAFRGSNIIVPEPEAYALHKMIINHRRGIKAEKDRAKIAALLPYLSEVRMMEIKNTLSEKEISLLENYKRTYIH